MSDTAKLIAQARDEVMHLAANSIGDSGALYLALAAALDAAEAERDELRESEAEWQRRGDRALAAEARAEAAEAERDALQSDVDKLVGKIGGLMAEIRRLREAAAALLAVLDAEDDPRWDGDNEYSRLHAALADGSEG